MVVVLNDRIEDCQILCESNDRWIDLKVAVYTDLIQFYLLLRSWRTIHLSVAVDLLS